MIVDNLEEKIRPKGTVRKSWNKIEQVITNFKKENPECKDLCKKSRKSSSLSEIT